MKETLKNNKLIAEFMGLSYCTKFQYEGWYKNQEHNHRICDYNGLKYHEDWNWLMSVVRKVEKSLSHMVGIEDFECVIVEIKSHKCMIYLNTQFGMTEEDMHLDIYESEESTIASVYRAVVEYIKWYNKLNLHLSN